MKLSKGQLWLGFTLSVVVCALFLMFKSEWFWVTLPFMLTSLVYALDVA